MKAQMPLKRFLQEEEEDMNSIKRFFRDEAATAEATSTVIMIAAVGILLAAGLAAWYVGLNTAFTTGGSQISTITSNIQTTFPAGS
jgi:predicted negative regulator of RcsB-dependent stress response